MFVDADATAKAGGKGAVAIDDAATKSRKTEQVPDLAAALHFLPCHSIGACCTQPPQRRRAASATSIHHTLLTSPAVQPAPFPTQRIRTEVILNCVALAVILLTVGRFSFGWLAFALVVMSGINHRRREYDAQERRDIHRIHRAANYRIREVMPHPPNWIRYSEKERVLFLTNMIKVCVPVSAYAFVCARANAGGKVLIPFYSAHAASFRSCGHSCELLSRRRSSCRSRRRSPLLVLRHRLALLAIVAVLS